MKLRVPIAASIALSLAALACAQDGRTVEREREGDLPRTISRIDSAVRGAWALYEARRTAEGDRTLSHEAFAERASLGDAKGARAIIVEKTGPSTRSVLHATGDARSLLVALIDPRFEVVDDPTVANETVELERRSFRCLRADVAILARKDGATGSCTVWLSEEVPGIGIVKLGCRWTSRRAREAWEVRLVGFGPPGAVAWGRNLMGFDDSWADYPPLPGKP